MDNEEDRELDSEEEDEYYALDSEEEEEEDETSWELESEEGLESGVNEDWEVGAEEEWESESKSPPRRKLIRKEKSLCPYCGEEIIPRGELCPFCGEKLAHCCVCNLAICKDEEIYQCPNCDAISHKNHWQEWIKIRGKCPICKEKP